MIASLQKTQKYLESHQPVRTEGFWVSVYQCESMRINIIIDLLRADHLKKQGKRIRARKRMVEANKETDKLKISVNQLKTYSRLTEKQKSVRDKTISRCKRTMNRVRNMSSEYKKL